MLIGAAAFLLMLLGDINDAAWHKGALRPCFPTGLVLLAATTALRLDYSGVDAAWCAVSGAFLLVLLYVLFGSFSVKDAYVRQDSGRRVYDKGFYALCRHPGVLFFAGLYLRCTMLSPFRGRMLRCTARSIFFLRQQKISGFSHAPSADTLSIKNAFRFLFPHPPE